MLACLAGREVERVCGVRRGLPGRPSRVPFSRSLWFFSLRTYIHFRLRPPPPFLRELRSREWCGVCELGATTSFGFCSVMRTIQPPTTTASSWRLVGPKSGATLALVGDVVAIVLDATAKALTFCNKASDELTNQQTHSVTSLTVLSV